MANKKISEFVAAGAVGTSVVPVSDAAGTVTNKVTLASIAALGGGAPADNTVTTAKLANSAVTYAKLQNVSVTDRLLGRVTAGAGVVEEIPCTVLGRSVLASATAAAARTALGLSTVAATGNYSDLAGVPDPLLKTGGTITGNLIVNGAVAANGARSAFAANNEQYALGARYNATGGVVYFGATNATAAPDIALSNTAGATLMLLQAGGNVGIGTTAPTQKLHVNGTITATKSLAPFDVSARSYSREWIEFPNYTGLLSANNSAFFRPNDGTYGGWKFTGARNGWAGVEFSESNTSLMQALDGNTSGFHRNGYGWQFYWQNGEMRCFKNAYGGGANAVVLDSSNYATYIPALTKTLAVFTPRDNQPPQASFALLDTRPAATGPSLLVLKFDATVVKIADFIGIMPNGISVTAGVTVRLWWAAATATAGTVYWFAQLEKTSAKDLDVDHFATSPYTGIVSGATVSAAPATAGIETAAVITIASVGTLAAGDRFRCRIFRQASDATNDTMLGDAHLLAVEVRAV